MTVRTKDPIEVFEFKDGPLIVKALGCPVTIVDGEKIFLKMQNYITKPTIIFLVCNVTEWHEIISKKYLMEMIAEYPQHTVYITGCINEEYSVKYKKLGTIVSRNNMWNPESYKG